jgi:hypothetical protein
MPVPQELAARVFRFQMPSRPGELYTCTSSLYGLAVNRTGGDLPLCFSAIR